MEEIKKSIAESIAKAIDNKIETEEILIKLEVPKDKKNGDFSYPCFNLAKVLKKAPIQIAGDIKEKIQLDDNISNIEVINGYLNIYLNSKNLANRVLNNVVNEGINYGSSNIGNNQNIVIDYSSPNIAKPFHLGHLRNTVLGHAIYNLYKELGYNLVSINYLGDWGRQFGLLIEAYKLFGSEYDIEKDAIHALADMYVRISKLASEDEDVMQRARDNFKCLEDGNKEYTKLWEYFREISIKEYNRMYDILGCKFDSYNGEAFYNDKMGEVIETLDKKGVLKESQGAKVVEVGENIPPCIVVKSNGSTIYATRDLASILYRTREYNYTKSIYITGNDQILHFKQVFEVAKYLVDDKYVKGLVHVPYGMVRLKSGKMSTREGTVVYVDNLINDALNKAREIIDSKNPELNNKEEVIKKVGIGALIFNNLKTTKTKDVLFDLDETLRFDGETGPYIQYTYVRINSILNKSNFNIDDIKELNYEVLTNSFETDILKCLDKFGDIIVDCANEYEPSILVRYLIELASMFSRFYNECTILDEDETLRNARLVLIYAVSIVIKKGLSILGIECPDKM